MKQRVDLLIRNGVVLTVDPADRVITDGAVAVHGDRIVGVGPSAELEARYDALRMIDARNKLVMPGLVDTYHHAGHGMIKGIYRSGLGWPAGKLYFHATTPEWWHAEGLLTAVERVKFGVTTGVTIMGGTPARTDDPSWTERNAAAVEQVGTRSILGVGPPDPFISHIKEPWSGTFWDDGVSVERPFSYERTIEVSRDLFERLHQTAGGRVRMMLAIPYLCGMNPAYMSGSHHFLYSAADARLMAERAEHARALADEYGVLIHTHAARGVCEWAEEHYGLAVTRSVLGPDVIFAHANGMTERDVHIMAETGTAAAAVPFGSWNTSIGPCPIVEMIKHGIRVAISTDGAAPFHVSDLFVDLHRAMFAQWTAYQDMSVLPSGRAVRLVTIEAAAVLGLDHEIGSLEPGKKGDIILIDLDQPHLVPFVDPANMIAFYVRGNDVDTTIVDGVVLMEGRTVRSVSEPDVLAYAREEIARSFERIDITPYRAHGPGFWQGWSEEH